MRALVKSKADRGLWLCEENKPDFGDHDVLIRVDKAAICGTDLHIYAWDDWARQTVPIPMIIGHEFIGTVEAVGTHVRTVKPGDRVSGEGHIACGVCRNCRAGREHLCKDTRGVGVNRPGAFADYIVIPGHNAYLIPDDICDDVGAILDPLGNAVHTALAFDLVGEDVLITGAGPIGVMAAAIARHVGARHIVVTDVIDERLSLAQKMGATRAVRADETDLEKVMDELGMTEGFDVGLEMSGNVQALRQMIDAMINGGKIALLGIQPTDSAVNWNEIIFKGLTLKGIYGRQMFETWYKMLAMLESGLDVMPVISATLPIDEFERGFEMLEEGRASKIILDISG